MGYGTSPELAMAKILFITNLAEVEMGGIF